MKHPLETSVFMTLAAMDMAAANAFKQIYRPLETESVNDLMRHMNRFWRGQLNLVEVECPTVRSALEDNIDFTLWLSNFATYVAPFVIEHGLPATHSPKALEVAIRQFQQSYDQLQMSV